jgi:anti-anti-sigma factor
MEAETVQMTTTRSEDVATITIAGDFDVAVAFRPYEEMVALVDSGGLSRVVLDCAGVTFADSIALGMLLRMREHGRDTAIAFEIRNASAAIRRLLEITALAGDFDLR